MSNATPGNDLPVDRVGHVAVSSTDGDVWLQIHSSSSWTQLRPDEARLLACYLFLHARAMDGRGLEGAGGAKPGPAHFRCAMCGGIFELGDDDEARAEAESKGVDPDDSGLVCDECYAKTPWGKQ